MVKSGAGGLRLSEAGFAWLLVLPVVIGIGLVVVVPLAYSLWLSFTDPNPVSDAFHAALGFVEVGTASVHDGSRTVRYLSHALSASTIE